MDYRFYKDPDTGMAHCRRHGVTELEAISVLRNPGQQFRRKDGTLVSQGQTDAGRYLRVIYRRFIAEDYILVITAYDLKGKAKQAYRRRRRR
jgi:hypothetical protein